MISREYRKAFKLLKALHTQNPSVDEVLRYLHTKHSIEKGD